MNMFFLFHEMIEFHSGKLPDEKSRDENRIGDPGKTQMAENTFHDDDQNRNVNGQDPLE